MSKEQRNDDKGQSLLEDLKNEVLAADDTGMIRNEADIVEASTEDDREIPSVVKRSAK